MHHQKVTMTSLCPIEKLIQIKLDQNSLFWLGWLQSLWAMLVLNCSSNIGTGNAPNRGVQPGLFFLNCAKKSLLKNGKWCILAAETCYLYNCIFLARRESELNVYIKTCYHSNHNWQQGLILYFQTVHTITNIVANGPLCLVWASCLK